MLDYLLHNNLFVLVDKFVHSSVGCCSKGLKQCQRREAMEASKSPEEEEEVWVRVFKKIIALDRH